MWEKRGASPWIVSVLREGYQLEFTSLPLLSRSPTVLTEGSRTKEEILDQQFQTLLDKNALEPVLNPASPGFYSRIFVVPKASGGWRPVIDLSVLNQYLVKKPFRMETAETIRSSLPRGAWAVSLDLQDAYFHVPIHPSSRKYLRTCFRGKIYQFRALPFGLSSAPWLFTQIAKEAKRIILSPGGHLHMFLDDWLLWALSRTECLFLRNSSLTSAQELGWVINFGKSDLIPKQVFDFVGIHYDLIRHTAHPTQKNWEKLVSAAHSVLGAQSLTAGTWQSVLGIFMSQSRLVSFGRLHIRPMQWNLSRFWSQFRDGQDQAVPVLPESKEAARWWLAQDPAKGVPVTPPPSSVRLFTDACTKGWGAHLGDRTLQGRWSPQEQDLHINVLEMRAVTRALQGFQLPQGSFILISTDNTTVVSYVNNQGGTRSWTLWEETRQLFEVVVGNNWTLRAVHIPGKLNVVADMLSREDQVLPTEWSLLPQVVRAVFRLWDTPHVDLFATRFNHQLPVYVSPVPDPQAWAVDALSMSWEGLWAYIFPPHQVLTKVLSKIREQRCEAIVIAPAWPAQPWFQELISLSVDHPRRIPLLPKLLKQPRRQIFHQSPEMLHLHAWRLSGGPSREQGTRLTRQLESQLPRLSPQQECTRENGGCTQLGARGGESVLSVPLLLS